MRDTLTNWPSEAFDMDSVASLIWNPELGYLLQHREDIPHISFPGWWSLFGGSVEAGETAKAALKREMMEELELNVHNPEIFFQCTYSLRLESRFVRKTFFITNVSWDNIKTIVLHEGQGLGWFTPAELQKHVRKIVPYDLSALMLHASRHSQSV